MKRILPIIIVVGVRQLALVSAIYVFGGFDHTVKYGETLYRIGRMYGVSPYRISEANGLYNPNYIYAGQVLYIPSGGGYHPDRGQSGKTYHKVRYGETLFSLGRQYGVNPYRIARVNGLQNPNYIYAGQILYIPSGRDDGRQPRWGHNRVDPNYRQDGCNYGCSGSSYYGYDYTGYYYVGYYPVQKQYSYTCGYYHNCW